jgi:hypothetical protein
MRIKINYAGTRIIKEIYIFKNVVEFIRKKKKKSSITRTFDMCLENNAMLAISNYTKVIVFSISFYTLLIKVRKNWKKRTYLR